VVQQEIREQDHPGLVRELLGGVFSAQPMG
jgi:hypothetical protein